MDPLVSVVLPVYNCSRYVATAIESILGQTFGDFELIILDDGSTDRTAQIVRQYTDRRILHVTQSNRGLAQTLNRGIELARGKYIARHDGDDISLPDRLIRQVEYLEAHPDCGLLGTWSVIWENEKETPRGHHHPCDNGELQLRMLFDTFLVHSSVMMRRAALDISGVYSTDPQRNPPEDFDLWLRLIRHCGVANIPEVLLIYREVIGSISRTKAALIQRRAIAIASENLRSIIGNDFSEHVVHDLVAVIRHADDYISAQPNWIDMEILLGRIESYILGHCPSEPDAVRRGAADLRSTLMHRRLREPSFGSKVRKLYALVRKSKDRTRGTH